MRALLFSLLLAAALPASAQTTSAVDIDIPAQALDSALKQLAEKQQLQVVFAPQDVRGLRTAGAKGKFTPVEAVAKLTEGTNLAYSFNGRDTVVIKAQGAERGSSNALGGTSQNPTLLAQAQNPSAGASDQPTGSDQSASAAEKATGVKEAKKAETVTVTGTRLKGPPHDGPQEVRRYNAEQFQESGQPTLVQFLNTLPEVSQGSFPASFSAGAQSTIQLRGFPVGTTLVLLDGHHAPHSGLGQ